MEPLIKLGARSQPEKARALLQRTSLVLPLVAAMLFFALPCNAQSRPSEYQVKAAYLYNFGKFVRWPDDVPAKADFNLCILGSDPFEGALKQVTSSQSIQMLPVKVQKISSPEGIAGCRVLFINGAEINDYRSAIPAAKKDSVLTVSDAPDFLQLGGMIQFVFVGDRVRFEVNLDAARDAGLQLSAELLKVATHVIVRNAAGVGR